MSFFQMLKSLMVKEQCMCIYIYWKVLYHIEYCLFLFPLWFLHYGVYPQHIVYFAVDSEGEALKRCNPKTLFDFFDWYMGFLGCETYNELYVINLSDESLLTIQFDGSIDLVGATGPFTSWWQKLGLRNHGWSSIVMFVFWGVWYIYRYGNCMAQDY